MALIATFVPVIRELRYQWNMPLEMSNAKLVAVLGHEPHEPLDEALAGMRFFYFRKDTTSAK